MRRVGLVGGLSPESTISYYAYLTRTYVLEFGECSYPEIIIYSVSLEKYHQWRNAGRWDLITEDLVAAGKALERAGAEVCAIATNTMHKVFREVQDRIHLPLINIVDVTVAAVQHRGIRCVGLIGTRFTMTDPFFVQALERAGIRTVVPDASDIETIHSVIENELVKNIVSEPSRRRYLEVISRIAQQGIEGVILGCTEIPLLIRAGDTSLPLFDTALIHSEAIYRKMTQP